MRRSLVLLLPFLLACPNPTKFEGEAKFPNGVMGCQRQCAQDGLQMAAFIYSGEFATSCACQPPPSAPAAGVETASPTAGVIIQVQAAAAAAAAAHQRNIQMQQQQQQRRY